jgi:hypothetical protein
VIPQPLLLARYQALVQRRLARQATTAAAAARRATNSGLQPSTPPLPAGVPLPPQATAAVAAPAAVHSSTSHGAVLPSSGHSTYTLTPRGNVTTQPQYDRGFQARQQPQGQQQQQGHHYQQHQQGWVGPEVATQYQAAVQGMLGALELGATEEPSKAQVRWISQWITPPQVPCCGPLPNRVGIGRSVHTPPGWYL